MARPDNAAVVSACRFVDVRALSCVDESPDTSRLFSAPTCVVLNALRVVEVKPPTWADVSRAVESTDRFVVVNPPIWVADNASTCVVLSAPI